MATHYQVKVHGKWRDVQLPWVSLDGIVTAVERSGEKMASDDMKFFRELAIEKWGDTFKKSLDTKNADGRDMSLTLDCVMVLIHRHDTLKLGICWEVKNELPSKLTSSGETRRQWEEQDGFIEVTILPGN